jgi:hypothetical protein
MQTCQAAHTLAVEAACEGSIQAELDCISTNSANACGASQSVCQTVTLALGACITNHCAHPRTGLPNQGLCLQAAVGL